MCCHISTPSTLHAHRHTAARAHVYKHKHRLSRKTSLTWQAGPEGAGSQHAAHITSASLHMSQGSSQAGGGGSNGSGATAAAPVAVSHVSADQEHSMVCLAQAATHLSSPRNRQAMHACAAEAGEHQTAHHHKAQTALPHHNQASSLSLNPHLFMSYTDPNLPCWWSWWCW